jgi:hypothetical protein
MRGISRNEFVGFLLKMLLGRLRSRLPGRGDEYEMVAAAKQIIDETLDHIQLRMYQRERDKKR